MQWGRPGDRDGRCGRVSEHCRRPRGPMHRRLRRARCGIRKELRGHPDMPMSVATGWGLGIQDQLSGGSSSGGVDADRLAVHGVNALTGRSCRPAAQDAKPSRCRRGGSGPRRERPEAGLPAVTCCPSPTRWRPSWKGRVRSDVELQYDRARRHLHLQAPTSVRGFDPRPGSEPRACPARPLRPCLPAPLAPDAATSGPTNAETSWGPPSVSREGSWQSPRLPPPLRATRRRTEWCQREGTCRRRGRGPRARRLGPRSRIPTRPTIALLTRGPATTMPMPRPVLATPARSRPTRQHLDENQSPLPPPTTTSHPARHVTTQRRCP